MGTALTWPLASSAEAKRSLITIAAPASILTVDARYWATLAAGLLIGVMARYAVMLSLERKVGWREIKIDALILLANGLLTVQFAEAMGLSDVKLAAAASLFGASSTMIFSSIHRAFVERVSGMPAMVFAGPDSVTQVPAVAPAVTVKAVGPDAAQSTADVMRDELAALPVEPTPPDMTAALRRIDKGTDG